MEVRNKQPKSVLQLVLDEGEAETIVLALEANTNLVLLDDREARLQAKRLGLKVAGTIGVLLRAKKLELINSLKAELDKLRETGFRVSKSLEEEVLRAASEY